MTRDREPLNGLDTVPAPPRVPLMEPMTFIALRGIEPQMPAQPYIKRGISLSTRRLHIRIIKELMRIPECYDTMPIAEAIVSWVHRRREGASPGTRVGHRWKWSTVRKEMGSIAGALKNLSTYDPTRNPIRLAQFPSWRAALKTADSRKNSERKQQAKAASLESVLQAMATASSVQEKQLLALMWLTAARPSDALQLRREDLSQLPQFPDQLSVTFKRGKVVKAIGPYTVDTSLQTAFKEPLLEILADPVSRWIWLAPTLADRQRILSALNRTLKSVDPLLTSYSIRRGAIQHLADSGADLKTLLGLSGHTNQRQLMQYLDFGNKFRVGKEIGLKRGQVLASRLNPVPPSL
jgi:integrase